MGEIKRIYPKIILFVLVVASIGSIYKHVLFEGDLEKYAPIIFNLREVEHQAQIVYFGESSNFTSNPSDSVKKRISEFAAEYYPGLNFTQVDNSAYHAAQYKTLLENIADDSTIETLIITMNLRSFGADWIYSNLETALQKSMVLLDTRYPPFINRLRLSLKDYEIKSDEERNRQVLNAWDKETFNFPFEFKYTNVNEWDRAMAYGSYLNADGSWDMPKINLACHFIKNYAFSIDTVNNPRITDYDEIVVLAHERGWNLVFNLMAENLTRAQEYVGDELVWLMEYNRTLLVERYQNKGVIVVDNLDDVCDSLFIDRDWPTEHYFEAGRRIVAANLADSLKRFYPEDYTLAKINKP